MNQKLRLLVTVLAIALIGGSYGLFALNLIAPIFMDTANVNEYKICNNYNVYGEGFIERLLCIMGIPIVAIFIYWALKAEVNR